VVNLIGRFGLVLFLLLPGAAVAAVTPQAGAEVQAAIERIEDYLNDLDNVRARVVQINPNGNTVTGTFYLARPNRLRLEYDRPSQVLIVANRGQLVYHDPLLNQLSYLRVDSTPLGFLLTNDVSLDGAVTVTDFQRAGGELLVTLARTDDPAAGQITLRFADSPLELLGWAVRDPQGLTTHVVLEELDPNARLRNDLFVFMNPRVFGNQRR
jgi:outer membrane lipoprotein-sorting protein